MGLSLDNDIPDKIDNNFDDEEEGKSPNNKKINGTGRVENVSNISTQRASQVINRFTSQVSYKSSEKIKEDIA